MSIDPAPSGRGHPIVGAVVAVRRELAGVRDVEPVFMSAADKRAALKEITAVEAQVASLKLRLMAAAGDVVEEDGAAGIGPWLSHHTNCEGSTARAEALLAVALDIRYTCVATGLADGAVSREQAQVIVAALDALPATVGVETLTLAEKQLVDYCDRFKPHELRRLGRKILEVVAPEIAEDEEARRLEEEETGARKRMRLSLKSLGDGTTRISGVLPEASAARLRTYLEAYTSPRHATGTIGEADRIPYPRKLAQAFCSLLEHLDPNKLPLHGGDATTVMVTVTLDALKAELASAGMLAGDLSLGDNLTASEARRLACTARIIPVVLGNHSEVLDLGRADRLFRPAQRKAIRLRDQTCRAEGCDHPATWCEVHHLRPWSQGGRTDLKDGILLCPFHHHRVHDPAYDHQLLPDGDLRFTRKRT